jgi:LysR family transcriptional regulator, cell division regulator
VDVSDLKVFEAVARVGNITKAATILNTVQSNVTTRIRMLEDELGGPLFHRHVRGVTLTAMGERLLPYAMRISQLVAEAKSISDHAAPLHGKLLVGTLETAAAMRLPPILTAFKQRFPKVELILRTGTTCDLIDDVLQHRLEGAFVVGPVSRPNLLEEVMFAEELVIIAPRTTPTLDSIIQADEIDVLAFRAGCSYRRRLDAWLTSRGFNGGIRYLELGTLEGIIGLVASGSGIALLPRITVERAWRDAQVALYELRPEESISSTVFIRRRDSFGSNALLRFVETAKMLYPSAEVPADNRIVNLKLPRGRNGVSIASGGV